MKRLVGIALLSVLLLAGCTPTTETYSASTEKALQERVLAVTAAASSGAGPEALAQVDALQKSLDSARDDKSISQERYDRIEAAITLVRADLASSTASPTPTASPVATFTPPPPGRPGKHHGKKGKDD